MSDYMKSFLLFPRSMYLNERWWHRLMTVVFWAWITASVIFSLNLMILAPWKSCFDLKFRLQDPDSFDCGANALDYAILNLKEESAPEIVGGATFFLLLFYLLLISPSILYRIILYVAKGSTWRG